MSRRASWGVVAFAAAFPTVIAWLYFDLLAGAGPAAQYAVYAPGKLVQFALPLVWALGMERWSWRAGWHAARRVMGADLALGAASGLVVAGIGITVYHLWLAPAGVLAPAAANIEARVLDLGLASPAGFVVLAVVYSTVHAGAEEYYWRWFVFGRARALMPAGVAVVFGALAFTAHHVVVLAQFFGATSAWTWLLAALVALGGALWCVLYQRSGSLWGAWLSHALVDAGIFVIGFDLLF